MSSIIRLWADDEGESHFKDVELAFEEADFVPPAPPVSDAIPVILSREMIENLPRVPDTRSHIRTKFTRV